MSKKKNKHKNKHKDKSKPRVYSYSNNSKYNPARASSQDVNEAAIQVFGSLYYKCDIIDLL